MMNFGDQVLQIMSRVPPAPIDENGLSVFDALPGEVIFAVNEQRKKKEKVSDEILRGLIEGITRLLLEKFINDERTSRALQVGSERMYTRDVPPTSGQPGPGGALPMPGQFGEVGGEVGGGSGFPLPPLPMPPPAPAGGFVPGQPLPMPPPVPPAGQQLPFIPGLTT